MKRVFAAASVIVAVSAIAIAQPSAQSPEQQVTKANTEFFQAMVQRDATSWNKRVADNALLSGFGVGCTSKSKAFSALGVIPQDKTPSFKTYIIKVRPQGNTSVVVGDVRVKGVRGGKPFVVKSGFMNVFAKQDGDWKLIASNIHPVKQP